MLYHRYIKGGPKMDRRRCQRGRGVTDHRNDPIPTAILKFPWEVK